MFEGLRGDDLAISFESHLGQPSAQEQQVVRGRLSFQLPEVLLSSFTRMSVTYPGASLATVLNLAILESLRR